MLKRNPDAFEQRRRRVRRRRTRHLVRSSLRDFQMLMSSLSSRGRTFTELDKDPIEAGRPTLLRSTWEIQRTLLGTPYLRRGIIVRCRRIMGGSMEPILSAWQRR